MLFFGEAADWRIASPDCDLALHFHTCLTDGHADGYTDVDTDSDPNLHRGPADSHTAASADWHSSAANEHGGPADTHAGRYTHTASG